MAASKSALKAAKNALDAHKYGEAIEHAKKVLSTDANNYHALDITESILTKFSAVSNVFLGLALDKEDENDESEKAYNVAARAKASDPLVWQGLITLYEKQASRKLGEYHGSALHLAGIYMEADDKTRCQTVIDRYVDFARRCGSQAQYRHALEVLLPSSTIYDYLEGRILRPGYTYTKIADIVENEEKELLNKEIGQRRTRLGAKLDQVTSEVKRELAQKSQLEDIYRCIIDWTDDDESRRHYEEKLLEHAYDTLAVLPAYEKAPKRDQVQALAEGIVILKHPFALAWRICLEWKDVEQIGQLDQGILREFVHLFPEDGLSKVLHGYLESEISPFPKMAATGNSTEESQTALAESTIEERLLQMIEGSEDCESSILSKRIMGEYYLYLEEYGSAADIARKAQTQLLVITALAGLPFQNIADAVDIILGTALVQYQAPRHHPEARKLFEHIMKRKPTNISALIGVGYILEEEEEYQDAMDFLTRALERTSDVKIRAESAWCKSLVGDIDAGLSELEACLSSMQDKDPQTKSLRAQTLYRIGMCIWTQDSSRSARKSRQGAYSRFLASIQADMSFAPSYTILGIYYSDYVRDKNRARKCFQKAFELSASEIEAAERLTRSFAKSGEWDLVEAVAQRVVDSGKVRPAPGSKKKGYSWPFAALGVVQLNNQEYAKSIVSFQSALRSSPRDYHSWVGLGEGYHNSGRYVAATKAFEHAQKLEGDPESGDIGQKWFTEYMLANVQRELGGFDEAISRYEHILTARQELGVSLALLQTLVEGAWRNIELGFFGRAAEGAGRSIIVAQNIATKRTNVFNLWKAVGDACSIFSWVGDSAAKAPIDHLRLLFDHSRDSRFYDTLANIDKIDEHSVEELWLDTSASQAPNFWIIAAILAQKRAVACSNDDLHARAVAWYNLGWTEYRAHVGRLDEMEQNYKKGSMKYLKACVQCFKRAIELEAGNAEFWNALGIVTTEMNPRVSQHSFVRSLYLNEKNARVWTNLGTLYLIQADFQLAHEALTRAQSTDPDYAHAWLGQGILAQCLGEVKEAQSLFTHAFEISDSSSVLAKRQYVLSIFDLVMASPSAARDTANFVQPLLALRQVCRQGSTDLAFQHLLSLFAERIGDSETAVTELLALCSKLEVMYESSESSLTLVHFAQAKGDLARAYLAVGDFSAAAANAETALDLSADEGMENTARNIVRLSGHLTAGLAYFHQDSMDQAIEMFRCALQETQGDPDIVCLLAQVLWAKGHQQEQDVAREQLFDCIERYPGHFGAITMLGTIALIDEDTDTLEAVKFDLTSLQTREDLGPEQKLKVAQLLTAIAQVDSGETEQSNSQMSQATAAVMVAPSQPHGWLELGNLTENSFPAEMGLLAARRAVPPVGQLEAEALCKAFTKTGRLCDSQRAILTAPWSVLGWQNLKELLTDT
ncbi:MAG: hypothetical protein Q9195_000342 [Heterodermia aff. obscurata]